MVLPVVLQQGHVPDTGDGFDVLDKGGVPACRKLDGELGQSVVVPVVGSFAFRQCPAGLAPHLRLHGFGEFAEDPVAGVGAGVVDHEDVGVPDTLL